MSFIKRLWVDPVWSTVIAAGITAALALAIAELFDLQLLSTVWGGVVYVWIFLGKETPVINWLLLIGILLSLFALFIFAVLVWLRYGESRIKVEPSNPIHGYREDNFFRLNWRWKYAGEEIHSLMSFCSNCDLQLLPHRSGYIADESTVYHCEDCRQTHVSFPVSPSELEEKVKLQIQKKIRTSSWQKS